MGSFSIWHWLVVLAVVLLFFGGGGRLSKTMGDFGKGIRALREGLKGEDEQQNKVLRDERPVEPKDQQ
jgi:sec-independent protein translocase protein TatA